MELIGVEAGGQKSDKHAAPLTYGSKIGILHGAAQYVNQNSQGQIEERINFSRPGLSRCFTTTLFFKRYKWARYTAASDEDALSAFKIVTKFENLRPSLEASHAFYVAIKEAKKLSKETIVVVNSCGDAHKDEKILKVNLEVNMINPISQTFKNLKLRKKPALTYTVAGDDTKKRSLDILKSISKYADICELGFPHNTPIADRVKFKQVP